MNHQPGELAQLLDKQLRTVPVVHDAVKAFPQSDGRLLLTIPARWPWWARLLLPASRQRKEKRIELDAVGAAVFELFDGVRTLEQIVDRHKDRWQLSFFESRAVILEFLKRLGRYDLLYFRIPQSSADEPKRGRKRGA